MSWIITPCFNHLIIIRKAGSVAAINGSPAIRCSSDEGSELPLLSGLFNSGHSLLTVIRQL